MTKQTDLIAYIFDGQANLLSAELFQWMEGLERFTTFVETYRDKIRKKVRTTRQPESILDLRGELEVAYRLSGDRRLELAYEPYASKKRRGPDFAVTYRANLVFNIEVARIRGEAMWEGGFDLPRVETRILRTLLDKLGQTQPGLPNLLVIQSSNDLVKEIDLGRLMQSVKIKVEGKDASFYAASPYSNPAEFYKDFLQLNAILLRSASPQTWNNKQARPSLPGKVLLLVSSLLH